MMCYVIGQRGVVESSIIAKCFLCGGVQCSVVMCEVLVILKREDESGCVIA